MNEKIDCGEVSADQTRPSIDSNGLPIGIGRHPIVFKPETIVLSPEPGHFAAQPHVGAAEKIVGVVSTIGSSALPTFGKLETPVTTIQVRAAESLVWC